MKIYEGGSKHQKAAQRRTAQNVDFKENLQDLSKAAKRGKNRLKHKAEMELFRLKHHKEMMDEKKNKKGALNTEKNNPLKLPIKKPIPMRTQGKSNFPEMDKAKQRLMISKYQGDPDPFTGKPTGKKRYF